MPKDEANVELGELQRARFNVHGDFDPIKLCISWTNVVRTRVDKVSKNFRHDDWKETNLGGCAWTKGTDKRRLGDASSKE